MRNALALGMMVLMFFVFRAFPQSAWGQMEHSGTKHEHAETKHEHVMKPPTAEMTVDGIKVQFWVETMMEHHQMMEMMDVPMEGMKMDADSTHEITVALIDEAKKELIKDAKINLKIIRPDGSDQIKMGMWMEGMDHYGADFRMDQKGRYQILTLFKVGDKKHKAGFYYEASSESSAAKASKETGKGLYACPMPSDDYFSRMPGKCPKCGMNLEKVDEGTAKNLYTCPMPEDDYFSHNPGKCPKCGMNLVPKK
jgi:hypothetical protein